MGYPSCYENNQERNLGSDMGQYGTSSFKRVRRSAHSHVEGPERCYKQPMIQLASKIGRSLLFPVQCMYCDLIIYLYANTSGVFAIFQGLGPLWPKHVCSMQRQPMAHLEFFS